jgi:hypothetical protein
MASTRLFNSIGKYSCRVKNMFVIERSTMLFEFDRSGRIGIGIALAGGVINSMLYNGTSVEYQMLTIFIVLLMCSSRWWTSCSYFRSFSRC